MKSVFLDGVRDVWYRAIVHIAKKHPTLFSDKTIICAQFYRSMGYPLNLKKPITFSEKLQWLKLYDRNPLYTILTDKIKVKDYVADKIGAEYIIPTLGVWDKPEDISLDDLPRQFVLKCNHNSGIGLFICKDKSGITPEKWTQVLENLNKGLKEDYYLRGREWPYKNIPRKILAERYMSDNSASIDNFENKDINRLHDEEELRDYKFFCFDGVPHLMFIAKDRNKPGEETKFDFFDMNFNHLPITNGHPNSEPPYEKPSEFGRMKSLAAELSKGFPHVRVDFYESEGRIYFGELTFFHWSGLVPFEPHEWEVKLGKLVNIDRLPVRTGIGR